MCPGLRAKCCIKIDLAPSCRSKLPFRQYKPANVSETDTGRIKQPNSSLAVFPLPKAVEYAIANILRPAFVTVTNDRKVLFWSANLASHPSAATFDHL